MENIKLKELAQEYFATYKTIDEQSLYTFLADNQWKIYADYNRNTHREKIVGELEYNDYDVDKIPEELIDSMVERFEDIFYDDDSNPYDNCIRYTIDDYEEDLEEYKIINIEDDGRSEMPWDYTNHFDSGEEDE